jgi:hypothetical protein
VVRAVEVAHSLEVALAGVWLHIYLVLSARVVWELYRLQYFVLLYYFVQNVDV